MTKNQTAAMPIYCAGCGHEISVGISYSVYGSRAEPLRYHASCVPQLPTPAEGSDRSDK